MTAARRVGEVRAVEMSAQNAGAAGAVVHQTTAQIEKDQMLLVAGDGGGRQQAGGTVTGVGAADGAEGVGGAVHEVGAGAAVDVQVHEAGNGGFVGRTNFLRPCRQADPGAWADGLDDIFADQDAGILDFCCRTQRRAGVNENGRHGSTTS